MKTRGIGLYLKNIYTAKQCTDWNDCDTAIAQVKALARLMDNKYTPAMRKRLASLEARKRVLSINVTRLKSLPLY